jgi:predicted dehydrogenase
MKERIMIDRPVRVGLIGCGAQARVHAGAVEGLGPEKAVVAALCDLDPKRLDALGQRWPQARRTRDFRQMLEPGDLDLVVVVTMPNTHAEMALAALDAGAHVLCEKPFMMNMEQAEQVLAKAAEVERQVQLATNMRYMPGSRYLHQLVQSGDIGQPVFAKAWGTHHSPPVWGPHYHLATSGGGVLASTLVHTLDLAMWVSGWPNPVSVSAATSRLFPLKRGPKVDERVRQRYDAEDLVSGFVRFDNGMYCSLEGNWCSEVQDFHSFQVTTTRGTVTGSPFSVLVDEGGEIVDRTPEVEGHPGWNESVHRQDEELIERLRQGLPWDAQDSRQLLNLQKVVDGCYTSAQTGREVVF